MPVAGRPRENGLFDRKKRADFFSRRADRAKDGRDGKKYRVLSLTANIHPASAISAAPAINSALRPRRSATPVMMIVITAPPASAAVKIQPIAAGPNPTASRYSPRMTERNP